MAAQKKLEAGSKYASFDKDGDGIVTDEEFEMEQKLIQLENEDKKQDAQRNMAWFACLVCYFTLLLLLLQRYLDLIMLQKY